MPGRICHPPMSDSSFSFSTRGQEQESVLRQFDAKTRKDPHAFECCAAMLNDTSFHEKIKKAAADPSSEVAKWVLRAVLPVLMLGANDSVLAGSLGDKSAAQRGIAQRRRHGAGCTFLTVTPDDTNNPTSIRLSVAQTNNADFPASDDGAFCEALHGNSKEVLSGDIKVPLDCPDRVKLMVGSPVAVARPLRALVKSIMEILIGCPLVQRSKNDRRKTTFCKDHSGSSHHKGTFGTMHSFFGSIETQIRGALHFHTILWGSTSPELLERSCAFPDVCDHIGKVLDSMHSASIPASAQRVETANVQSSAQTAMPALIKWEDQAVIGTLTMMAAQSKLSQ